jgi:hypothetical protein
MRGARGEGEGCAGHFLWGDGFKRSGRVGARSEADFFEPIQNERPGFDFIAISLCDEIVATGAGLKIFVEMRTASALQHLTQKYVSLFPHPAFFPAAGSCAA